MDVLVIGTLIGFIGALLVIIWEFSVELKEYKDEVEAYNKNQAEMFKRRFDYHG